MQTAIERIKQDSSKTFVIEPLDREWGVGVTSMGDSLSPYTRVNRLRKLAQETEFTVNHERACLVTEAYEKYKYLNK